MTVDRVAWRFVDAINRLDIEAICSLMTEGHRFVDASGQGVAGGERMGEAWIGCFKMVPDYAMEAYGTYVSGDSVVLLGRASGTYNADGSLRPEDRLALWPILAGNEPVRDIIRRDQAS